MPKEKDFDKIFNIIHEELNLSFLETITHLKEIISTDKDMLKVFNEIGEHDFLTHCSKQQSTLKLTEYSIFSSLKQTV